MHQKVIWISGTGDRQKKKKRKRDREGERNTHTSSHDSLPFPLPSCANLDMIPSEKSQGGSGFTAEMEDTTRVCVFRACILLHASVYEREREREPPHHTPKQIHMYSKYTKTYRPRNMKIPSRFNLHSCTNGMTRKASKRLLLR